MSNCSLKTTLLVEGMSDSFMTYTIIKITLSDSIYNIRMRIFKGIGATCIGRINNLLNKHQSTHSPWFFYCFLYREKLLKYKEHSFLVLVPSILMTA